MLMFVAMLSPSNSAWRLRSSGASPTPAETAACTDPGRTGTPSTSTDPLSLLRAPKTVSRISERPAPTSPAMPSTSPGRTLKLTSENSP